MEFKLISDVTQSLKKELFGPDWLSLGVAAITSSNISKQRYFFLLMNTKTSLTYIEEYVDFPLFFIKIEDQKLWNDLYMFFVDKGLTKIGIGQEFKIAKTER